MCHNGAVSEAGRETDRRTAADHVLPTPADASAFEQAFNREVLRSERLRISVVAGLVGFIFVRWLVLWFVVPELVASQLGGLLDMLALTVLWGGALLYELTVLVRINWVLRRGGRLPPILRYVNALVETSIPTMTLLLGVEVSSPALSLSLPATWGYFLFILLAILRLDFWLCVFTGAVAALEYTALAVYFLGQPQTGPLDPALVAPIQHSIRVAMLIGAGLLAGFISLRIRRQFMSALRSVEERNRIISMFGQHVSPAVVDKLLSQEVELGGEVRQVCVMFLDIQGFTAFAERRRPEEVVEYLNGLFAVMIDAVNRHHGIVNKFLGDGFMAVFGAPIADASACRNAVGASLAIVEKVRLLGERGEIAPTTVRIGLHAGEAVTGNVGSSERKEYTIIGDVVNLAARLEQLNKLYGSRVLVSEAVAEGLDGLIERAVPHGPVQVKGRERPVMVYELA